MSLCLEKPNTNQISDDINLFLNESDDINLRLRNTIVFVLNLNDNDIRVPLFLLAISSSRPLFNSCSLNPLNFYSSTPSS